MRKIPPSPFHGTSGFLLAEAPPQAPIISDCPSAAAWFSIAFDFARVRFIFENIFELDVDIVLFMWYTSDTRTNFLNRFAITTSYFCWHVLHIVQPPDTLDRFQYRSRIRACIHQLCWWERGPSRGHGKQLSRCCHVLFCVLWKFVHLHLEKWIHGDTW